MERNLLVVILLMVMTVSPVSLLAQKPIGQFVTPQEFGAKGDGRTDDTEAFIKADQSPFDVYVPSGKYFVTDFVFNSSKTWIFQRSKGNQWFADGNARLLSSTTTRVAHGAKIHNLRIDYRGNTPIQKRPVGLQLTSHFCEIHGAYVSYFYIGVELGGTGHCDYTKIYDLYSWYNYYCGVRMNGTNTAQVNFVSFYDCNVGSNGVSVHEPGVKPNTTRGYGFYIGTANGIYISNADVSSNETSGIYIDNSSTDKQTRGLSISMLYAEHNKHSNIYYNNGKSASPSNCRSRQIDITGAYFMNNAADKYFVSDVYVEDERFVPPTVSFLDNTPKYSFEDGSSPDMMKMFAGRSVPLSRIYGQSGDAYKVTISILPEKSGTITFQNIFYSYSEENGYYDEKRERAGNPFSVKVESGEREDFSFFITFPAIDKKLVYHTGNYGVMYKLLNCTIENVSHKPQLVGNPINGTTRILNGKFQVYIDGWRTVQIQ